jgi:hypothetical protein
LHFVIFIFAQNDCVRYNAAVHNGGGDPSNEFVQAMELLWRASRLIQKNKISEPGSALPFVKKWT